MSWSTDDPQNGIITIKYMYKTKAVTFAVVVVVLLSYSQDRTQVPKRIDVILFLLLLLFLLRYKYLIHIKSRPSLTPSVAFLSRKIALRLAQ